MGGRGEALERRRRGAAVKSEKRKVKSGERGGLVLNATGDDMGEKKGGMA